MSDLTTPAPAPEPQLPSSGLAMQEDLREVARLILPRLGSGWSAPGVLNLDEDPAVVKTRRKYEFPKSTGVVKFSHLKHFYAHAAALLGSAAVKSPWQPRKHTGSALIPDLRALHGHLEELITRSQRQSA